MDLVVAILGVIGLLAFIVILLTRQFMGRFMKQQAENDQFRVETVTRYNALLASYNALRASVDCKLKLEVIPPR